MIQWYYFVSKTFVSIYLSELYMIISVFTGQNSQIAILHGLT